MYKTLGATVGRAVVVRMFASCPPNAFQYLDLVSHLFTPQFQFIAFISPHLDTLRSDNFPIYQFPIDRATFLAPERIN